MTASTCSLAHRADATAACARARTPSATSIHSLLVRRPLDAWPSASGEVETERDARHRPRRRRAPARPMSTCAPSLRRSRRARSATSPRTSPATADDPLASLHRAARQRFTARSSSTPSRPSGHHRRGGLRAGRGVCQDLTHIFIAARAPLRHPRPLRLRLFPPRRRRHGQEPAMPGPRPGRRSRLGRLRPRQRHLPDRGLCARRHRPRLSRRGAGPRQPLRRRPRDGSNGQAQGRERAGSSRRAEQYALPCRRKLIPACSRLSACREPS